jgi:hypothetical protein
MVTMTIITLNEILSKQFALEIEIPLGFGLIWNLLQGVVVNLGQTFGFTPC